MKFILIGLLFFSQLGFSKKSKTLFLNDQKMESVLITPGRSVILSFPSRPNKVIVGNQGVFAVEYIENDLAIAALKAPARSNLFVYLEGRRFGFDLKTVSDLGDEIILVRDSEDKKIKVKIGEQLK
jgi:hypothetical protein